jgi:hypothetical protein
MTCMRGRIRILCLGLCLVSPRGARAQEPAADSVRTVAVDDSTRAAAAGAASGPITRARGGARVGLVVGGVTGAAGFVFIGLVAQALCEGDCGDDIHPAGWVGLGAVGALTGALAGAGVGYLIGSMIPAGEVPVARVPGAEGETPAPAVPAAGEPRRRIGSLSLQPGHGRLTDREASSTFTVRVTLLAHLRPWLGVGPEITHAGFPGGMNALGGAVVVGRRDRRFSPYVVGDLGWYRWGTGPFDTDVSLLGAGIGAGLAWAPGSGGAQLGLEARYHWTPQNIQDPEGYRFVNAGASVRFAW